MKNNNNNNHLGVIDDHQTRASSPAFHNESTHHLALSSSPNHMHMQGVRATSDSMKKTEWTDEKHSMYLKSIEATFVNQLYGSKHMIASQDPATTSGQFKVLRYGCWQKINFERENPQMMMSRNNNDDLTSNPWIQHYRSLNKQGNVNAAPSLQECVTSTSQIVDLGQRKKGISSASSSRNLHLCESHACHQDMLSSDTEMSDQNFVDEELEVEKENKRNKAKRHKALITDAKGNDQIVPSRRKSC